MKTAYQRADEFLMDKSMGMDSEELAVFIKQLAILLKEQDRDTRHACAEAVNLRHTTMSVHPNVLSCTAHNRAINEAYAACMNVRTV